MYRAYKIFLPCVFILLGGFLMVSYGGRFLHSKDIQDIICAISGPGWIVVGVILFRSVKKKQF